MYFKKQYDALQECPEDPSALACKLQALKDLSDQVAAREALALEHTRKGAGRVSMETAQATEDWLKQSLSRDLARLRSKRDQIASVSAARDAHAPAQAGAGGGTRTGVAPGGSSGSAAGSAPQRSHA